jgi:hypothetical protein
MRGGLPFCAMRRNIHREAPNVRDVDPTAFSRARPRSDTVNFRKLSIFSDVYGSSRLDPLSLNQEISTTPRTGHA